MAARPSNAKGKSAEGVLAAGKRAPEAPGMDSPAVRPERCCIRLDAVNVSGE